jgi:hypothetical protein
MITPKIWKQEGIIMTPEISDTLDMCVKSSESVSQVEIWFDETDSTYGIAVVDDGMMMVGFFLPDGHLIGDWC